MPPENQVLGQCMAILELGQDFRDIFSLGLVYGLLSFSMYDVEAYLNEHARQYGPRLFNYIGLKGDDVRRELEIMFLGFVRSKGRPNVRSIYAADNSLELDFLRYVEEKVALAAKNLDEPEPYPLTRKRSIAQADQGERPDGTTLRRGYRRRR